MDFDYTNEKHNMYVRLHILSIRGDYLFDSALYLFLLSIIFLICGLVFSNKGWPEWISKFAIDYWWGINFGIFLLGLIYLMISDKFKKKYDRELLKDEKMYKYVGNYNYKLAEYIEIEALRTYQYYNHPSIVIFIFGVMIGALVFK